MRNLILVLLLAFLICPQIVTAQSSKDIFKGVKAVDHLQIHNGETFDLMNFLAGYKIQPDNLGGIALSKHTKGNVTGLIGLSMGGDGSSFGLVGLSTGSSIRNVGVAAEAYGPDVWNIGVISRAADGSNNIAIEGEAMGKGNQINIGVVAKSIEYINEPGKNFGLLAKAFGNGNNDQEHFNTGVESQVSGRNTFNTAFRASIADHATHDGRPLTADSSKNYAFNGLIIASNSMNYGLYQVCEGEESDNIALFCKSTGGKYNLAAQFVGDIRVDDSEGNTSLFIDAQKGSLISAASYISVPGVRSTNNETIEDALGKLGGLVGLVYPSVDEPSRMHYGLDWKVLNEVMPELVEEYGSEGTAVNYQGLVPLLVVAINDLNEELVQLKAIISQNRKFRKLMK